MSDKTESTQETAVWCTPCVAFGGRGGLSSGFVVADGGGEVAFMVESLGFQRYGLARQEEGWVGICGRLAQRR
jgi:hypothetical protein